MNGISDAVWTSDRFLDKVLDELEKRCRCDIEGCDFDVRNLSRWDLKAAIKEALK